MAVYEVTVRLSASGVTAFDEVVPVIASSTAEAAQRATEDRVDFYSERDAKPYNATITRNRLLNGYIVYIVHIVSTDNNTGQRFEDTLIVHARNTGDAVSYAQQKFGAVFRQRTIGSWSYEEYTGNVYRLETAWGRRL